MSVTLSSANGLYKAGKHTQALEQYTALLLKETPPPGPRSDGVFPLLNVYLNRSSCYHSSGMFDEAVKDAEQAKAMVPTDMRVYSRLVVAYQGAAKHEDAIATCLEGLALNARDIGLQGLLSRSEVALGRDATYVHAAPSKSSYKHIGSHDHSHDHDHGHNHSHDHGHNHSHDHGHNHSHDRDHDHVHTASCHATPSAVSVSVSAASSRNSSGKRSVGDAQSNSPLHRSPSLGKSSTSVSSDGGSPSESPTTPKTQMEDSTSSSGWCAYQNFFCGLV